jgi:aryl-phospho-beta-D-glucosidase BglC (GH1 family)
MTKRTIYTAICIGTALFAPASVLAAPALSSIIATPGTNFAVVKWATDVNADSLVEYDAAGTFSLEVSNVTALKTHSVTLTNLAPGTTYFYRVSSSGGGVTTSGTQSFTTLSSATKPTVTFTASSVSVTRGASITFTWSSTNATSCAKSGAWQGATTTSGSMALAVSTTTTFTLSCSGSGGTASKSILVQANTANSNAPEGSLDEITVDGVVRGWTLDQDAPTMSSSVKIYINGPVGVGKLLTTQTTQYPRTDVNDYFATTGRHGFWYMIPEEYRDSLAHNLYIYGVDHTSPQSLALLTGAPATYTMSPLPAMPAQLPATCTFGVNLSGAENGMYTSNWTPVYGVDYVYPTALELDYMRSRGITLIRLPFQWEVLQPTLGAALNAAEVARINATLSLAAARGMDVILDLHNMGRYQDVAISTTTSPTVNQFADFWSRMATQFSGTAGVYAYDIMNEPHDMPNPTLWPAAAQAAVDAIRLIDTNTIIMVEGDNYSGAWTWRTDNENLDIDDPSDKIVYQAHQYFDLSGSGVYAGSYDSEYAYPDIGIDRLRPFVTWLRENGKRGFIGEFSVPQDDMRWQEVLARAVNYMKDNNISGTYWAAGSFSKYLSFSLEPFFGQDRWQMQILKHYQGCQN